MVTWITAGVVFVLLVIVQVISKAKHPVQKTIGSMLIGIGALVAVNIAGGFTGVMLPFSPLAIGVSASAGIPGVTLLLLLNLLLV